MNIKPAKDTLEDRIEKVKAENILKLVRHHKEHCNEDCGVSIYYLLEDFERHIGRKATGKEIRFFL